MHRTFGWIPRLNSLQALNISYCNSDFAAGKFMCDRRTCRLFDRIRSKHYRQYRKYTDYYANGDAVNMRNERRVK